MANAAIPVASLRMPAISDAANRAREYGSRLTLRRDQLRFQRRHGLRPPPWWSDLTGYDAFLDILRERKVLEVPGDVLEIGVLFGGGTYKLAKMLAREAPQKRVIAGRV